jgi:sodium-independent sulfate anion transporter 11
VIIDTLKHLPDTQRDAAFGLSGLFFLYLVRWGFARLERRSRNPVVKKIAFFATTLRTAFVIIILTAAAYAYCKDQETPKISILKTVPSGFKHMGQPKLPKGLLSAIAPELPVSTIILLLEHIVRFSFFPFFSNWRWLSSSSSSSSHSTIVLHGYRSQAIAKSFGRVNHYTIDPNQELIAIGVANTIGTLFNAYPATYVYPDFSASRSWKVRGNKNGANLNPFWSFLFILAAVPSLVLPSRPRPVSRPLSLGGWRVRVLLWLFTP